MNKTKKNVVVVGFTGTEKRSVAIPMLPIDYSDSQIVHYVDSLNEARRYQGYMIIINNSDNISIIELDKKYRKLFNKFEEVVIYNESYGDWHDYPNKWIKISLVGRDIFESDYFFDTWDYYKEEKENEVKEEIKYNKDKKERLNILFQYTKKYKVRKTSDIAKDLNMSERSIERYMKDLNNLYHNIGYDYSLNEWYFC